MVGEEFDGQPADGLLTDVDVEEDSGAGGGRHGLFM